MTSPLTFEISQRDLQELRTPVSASIVDVKHLSSYIWIEAPSATPTIVVPGCPGLWSPPEHSQLVKKDHGLIYVAQNAARHPQSPLEPLFRALYSTYPSFDIRSTDLVTDRNNIRKLLSFIDPTSSRNRLEAFTISVEVMKDTAIFCRNETNCVEYIGPQEFKGFGHEFEKAYTTAKINGSTGHHRVISYRLGNLKFIVRHETDAFVDTMVPSFHLRNPTEDDLSSMLGTLCLSSASIRSTQSRLVVKKGGKVVPLDSTIEIKTRVLHKSINIQEIAAQLWVSQTPKLVRAYHSNGTFRAPLVEDVAPAIKEWELRKQGDLRRLVALIRKIIDPGKACGGCAVVRYIAEQDKLVISEAEEKRMLPTDLYTKWKDTRTLGEDSIARRGCVQGPVQANTLAVNDPRDQIVSLR